MWFSFSIICALLHQTCKLTIHFLLNICETSTFKMQMRGLVVLVSFLIFILGKKGFFSVSFIDSAEK
jgi:hypothetical protein